MGKGHISHSVISISSLPLLSVFLILVFAISFSSQEASAAIVTWDGGGGIDKSWTNAANWDTGVPSPSDTVIISTPDCPTTQLTQILFNPVGSYTFTGDLTIGAGCFLSDQDSQTFTNHGTITVNGNYFVSKWTNGISGIVTVSSTGQLVFSGTGNENHNLISNNRILTIASSATLDNKASGIINHYGPAGIWHLDFASSTFHNEGTVYSDDQINIQTSATFANSGTVNTDCNHTVTGGGSIMNTGSINNVCGGSPPLAPSTPDLKDTSDSSVDTDNITNDNTPTFTGTAEADSTVEIFADAALVGSGTATGGSYTITTSALSDDVYLITATASNLDGTSPGSSALSVTIDTVVSAPTILDLSTLSDSGSSSTDNITQDNTPNINGLTGEAGSVALTSSIDGAIGTATAASPWDTNTSTLSDGLHSITAVLTDVAGNISSPSIALSVTIDTVAPSPTLAINGNILPDRTFSTSVSLQTTCGDGLGSGCDTFVVGGTGITNPTVGPSEPFATSRAATLTAGRDIAKSAQISSVTDKAGNTATGPFTDTIALDARILTVVPFTTTPYWGVNLNIDGTVENALTGDLVKVRFGSPTLSSPIAAGTFGVTGQYPQLSLEPNPHIPNATLTDASNIEIIDSTGTRVSKLGAAVNAQKHPTSISADAVTNPSAGNNFFVGGRLSDTVLSVPVPGKSISFENTGAPASLLDVTTGGITFADPDLDGANIVACVSCSTPDNIMRLNAGATITPARGTTYVGLHIQDMGAATITLRVTSTASSISDYTVITLSTNPVLFTASDPSGIDNIRITSVTGSPDVGLSSVKTYGQELGLINDIDFAPIGSAPSFTYDAGRFYSEGTSQSTATSSALSLDEKFYADADYLGTTSTVTYTVLESTTAGVGGSTAATADLGLGITSVLCDAGTGTGANQDTDSDSLCNIWEADYGTGNGIPFTVGGTPYKYTLPGTTKAGKDIVFEIDAMTSHTPDSTALANVKTAFAAEGVNLIHTLDDLAIPHLDVIKLWTDTDLIDANDFNSLKNDYYGTPSERPVMSLQNAQVSTSITATSVKLGSGGVSGITISIPTNSITSGATQGTIVAKIKTTVTVSNEKHRDTGATANVFDVGEAVYRDADYLGTVTIGDIRLANPPTPYTPGSVVTASDTDINGALVAFTTNEKHRDDGATLGLFDVGEAIYKDTDATNTVTAGGTPDIRLVNPPSPYTAGPAVAAGNTDINGALVAFAPYLTVGTITQPSSPAGLTLGTITAQVSTTSTSTQKIVTITIPFTTTGPISTTAIPEITIPFNPALSTAQVTAGVTNPGSPQVFTTLLNAKAQAVRYAIWAHSYGGPSGQSELKGNDLAVTLGAGFGGSLGGHTGSIGTTNEQAGTYMHELGHILNLQHGGADTNNCKPNYFSIMSYSRQLETFLSTAWTLSFSQGGRSSLTETALNEAVGLGGPGTGTAVYGSPIVSPASPTHAVPDHTFHSVAGNAATIDWDDSGTPAGTVTADINNFGFSGCTASTPTGTPYADFDDSTLFSFNFRDAPSGQFDGITIFQSDADGKVRYQTILKAGTFDGLDSPVPGNKVKRGSSIPMKLDITTGPTTVVDVPFAQGKVYVSLNNINGPYTKLTNQLTNTDDVQWIPSTHQIQFNWKTASNQPLGTYYIRFFLTDPAGSTGGLAADPLLIPGQGFLTDNVAPFKLPVSERNLATDKIQITK